LIIDIVKAPGGTGDYSTNLESKIRTALSILLDKSI